MCDEAHESEQELELSALEAIFDTDYELLSDAAPRQLQVRVVPVAGQDAGDENKVGIMAKFTLPVDYPDVVPEIEISALMGLTAKHCDVLVDMAKAEGENLIGTAMIFPICDVLREWLAENNSDQTDESMHAQMMRKIEAEKKAQEAEEHQKRRAAGLGSDSDNDSDDDKPRAIDGTQVTRENFLEWHAKFVDEMRKLKEANAPIKSVVSQKMAAPDALLTGREYFEQRHAAASAAGENGGEASAQDEWDADIQEDLFLEGDEDLDDLEDLEDLDDDDDDDDDDDEE
mmetsp:Transcript_11579/g.32800  ORF Transcript_11579/g.32800 Transcript_11579/m.32800 type:complete len:287 (+) Transcript_11579:67-927(+)